MRILIVEDSTYRIDWFKERLEGHVLDITKDTREAISWLKERVYDHIFLDHDLVDMHYAAMIQQEGESIEHVWDRIINQLGTGRDVTQYLRDNPICCPDAKIVVHSQNIPGAQAMFDDLSQRKTVVKVPFGFFEIKREPNV